MPSNNSSPANSSSSALTKTDGDNLLAEVFASARFIPSNSHGYFWDVEEIRHQEHLRRVSHAQHLYRHRHDSNEAAKLYRRFMEEQNEWMDEQERMKGMELRLSVKAYQQRASRWEDEWRRLEAGGNVEEILKPHRKSTAQLMTGSSLYGYLSVSGKESSTHGLSDLVISRRSTNSLDFPSPFLSYNGTPSRVFSQNTIQRKEGARSRNSGIESRLLSTPRSCDASGLDLMGASIHDACTLLMSQTEFRDEYTSWADSSGAVGGPEKTIHPCSETSYDPQDTPTSSRSQIMLPGENFSIGYTTDGSWPRVSARSPASSNSNWSRAMPYSGLKEQEDQRLLLSSGEILRILSHRHDDRNLLYLVAWRPQNSYIRPVQCWIKVADFARTPRRPILEEYHLRQNLGPVQWPRNPRRLLRSSTSFGVREINAALDERKQVLVGRGANLLEVSRELDKERWRMRDDWQRAGRGWGSAIMVVEDRKKAWKIADLEAEGSLARKTEIFPARVPSTVDSSSHVNMLKAAGIIDPDTHTGLSLGLKVSQSNLLKEVPPPKPPRFEPLESPEPIESPFGGDSSSRKLDEPAVRRYDEKETQYIGTSEDEREWREHFFTAPGFNAPTNLPDLSAPEFKLSRVTSTLRNLPNTPNLNLMRAKTLPLLGKGAEDIQVLNFDYQEPRGTVEPTDSIHSSSDSQNYLKSQRKSLLTRILSRRRSKKGERGQGTLYNLDVEKRRSRASLIWIATTREASRVASKGPVDVQQSDNCIVASPDSYASFDGAKSEKKTPPKKSWRECVWDKFSYILNPLSRNYTSPGRSTKRTPSKRRASEKPLLPTFEKRAPKRDGPIIHTDEEPCACLQTERRSLDALNLSGPLLVETITRRTATWAASMLSPLVKGMFENPGRLRSSFDEAESTTPKRDTVESNSNEHRSQTQSGESTPLCDMDCSYCNTGTIIRSKGKAVKATPSPKPEISVGLIRTLSQEQYLAARQAKREIQRDKAVQAIKTRAKMRKEKADKCAKDTVRFEELCAKKAFPFGKWRKVDQVELELLTKRLGMGSPPRRKPRRNPSKRTTVADIKNLRRAIEESTVCDIRGPRGGSPV